LDKLTLFVSQCIDVVHADRLAGLQEAEDDTDHYRGKQQRRGINNKQCTGKKQTN
jgi:hypothetical protein